LRIEGRKIGKAVVAHSPEEEEREEKHAGEQPGSALLLIEVRII
jgi:hypothetical protein